MARVVDQGVCLRHWDWSETSQTVSILTRAHGVVRGVAKGSKREKSPFSGGIEVATRAEVVFIPKQGALSVITAWDLQEVFPGVRGSSRRFFAAMHMLDLAQHFVQEGDPHPAVFDALVGCLRGLGEAEVGGVRAAGPGGVAAATGVAGGGAVGGAASEFRAILVMQWVCLDQAGLRPMVDRRVDTGGALSGAATFGLSAALGGVVEDPGPSPPAGVYRVRAETIALLRALGAREVADARGMDGGVDGREAGRGDDGGTASLVIPDAFADGVVERASRLLAKYCEHVLGRGMNSGALVFGGG